MEHLGLDARPKALPKGPVRDQIHATTECVLKKLADVEPRSKFGEHRAQPLKSLITP